MATDQKSTGPVIYIDRSEVHENRWGELKAGIHALVAFVNSHQPQMATYGFYLDENANRMTVVSVHPDSASLERHVGIGGPEFRKLAPFLILREIEVFGHLSDEAVDLVRQKASTLGGGGLVTLHEQFAGFDRLESSSMSDQFYTLGAWRVKNGNQDEFIEAWKALGAHFRSLPHPPGQGTLLQSFDEPQQFYSFGPWGSLDDVQEMRSHPETAKKIAKLMDFCEEGRPGSFRVVATV